MSKRKVIRPPWLTKTRAAQIRKAILAVVERREGRRE